MVPRSHSRATTSEVRIAPMTRHDNSHRTGDNTVLAYRLRFKPVAGLYINKRFKSLPVILRLLHLL